MAGAWKALTTWQWFCFMILKNCRESWGTDQVKSESFTFQGESARVQDGINASNTCDLGFQAHFRNLEIRRPIGCLLSRRHFWFPLGVTAPANNTPCLTKSAQHFFTSTVAVKLSMNYSFYPVHTMVRWWHTLIPANLLSFSEKGKLCHCLALTQELPVPCSGPPETLWQGPDVEVSVGGSHLKTEQKYFQAGCAVTTSQELIETNLFSEVKSEQQAEIIGLTQACQLARHTRANRGMAADKPLVCFMILSCYGGTNKQTNTFNLYVSCLSPFQENLDAINLEVHTREQAHKAKGNVLAGRYAKETALPQVWLVKQVKGNLVRLDHFVETLGKL